MLSHYLEIMCQRDIKKLIDYNSSGNEWTDVCSTETDCATDCAYEGADYSGTYGVTTSGNALTLKFVTQGPYSKNIGSRMYLMASDSAYSTQAVSTAPTKGMAALPFELICAVLRSIDSIHDLLNCRAVSHALFLGLLFSNSSPSPGLQNFSLRHRGPLHPPVPDRAHKCWHD